MTVPIGSAVLYWSGGGLGLGRVAAEEKQRLRVSRPQGADERITTGRVALIVERPAPGPAADDRDALRELDRAIREAAGRVDVALLWSLARETATSAQAGVDLQQLGPLAVDDVTDGVACAATLIAIRDERLHFERRGERWLARAPEAVETLRVEREQGERRAREIDELHLALAAAVRDGSGTLASNETSERVLSALRALAIDEEAVDGPPRRLALDALNASGQVCVRPGEGAFRLLRALGVWDDDVNLQVERFAIRLEFPASISDALEQIERASDQGSILAGRLDLTHLPTLSIDGSRTREIDDALSVESVDGAPDRFWIHIADPCTFIEPGGALDLEAFARGLSHYMPDLRVPMLPPQLSQDRASLLEGQPRPALSFGVQLDPRGGIAASRIERSLIRSDARLSYASADARLARGPAAERDDVGRALSMLDGFADSRRDARLRDGALLLMSPDVDLHVVDGGVVTLERIEADSASRSIVGEAMVLAGSLAAGACRDAGVPTLYRQQAPPSNRAPGVSTAPIDGVLEIYRQRRALRRAEVRLVPGPHASLGVEAYCQATSPLRRYQDLACHRQLLAAIAGIRAPHDEQELRRIAEATGAAERDARRAEAAARDYWRLRWFEQQGDRSLAATILEAAPRNRVLIDATQSVHPWAGAASHAPGEAVSLRVVRVNPRAGVVRFETAG